MISTTWLGVVVSYTAPSASAGMSFTLGRRCSLQSGRFRDDRAPAALFRLSGCPIRSPLQQSTADRRRTLVVGGSSEPLVRKSTGQPSALLIESLRHRKVSASRQCLGRVARCFPPRGVAYPAHVNRTEGLLRVTWRSASARNSCER